MRNKFIPVNKPIFVGNEIKYLTNCIKTSWIGSDGEYVKTFEIKLAEYVKRKFGIAVSSGSAALEIAFSALGLKKGDEVIMPSFTIISCLNPVLRVGAKPVFVDTCLETWNMDINQIEKKITKKTKIILAVHIYGLPVYMPKILKVAKKYNLKVIEDASEQIGQTIDGKQCGSFGDISTFSFYTNKHITTGEGGMIFTNNKLFKDKSSKLRNLYFDDKRRFVHNSFGWNYRMSNLQAAVGLAQLENINLAVKLKRKFGNEYHKELQNIDSIKLQKLKTKFSKNIFWVVGILVTKKNVNVGKIQKSLLNYGIQTRPFFWPMHLQPIYFKKLKKKFYLPNTEYISKRGFYLPSGLGLSLSQIKYICKKLKYILSRN